MAGSETQSLALPQLDPAPRLLLVVAPYYAGIAAGLVRGAGAVLDRVGATYETIDVPGALEIAPAIRIASGSGRYDGYIALGCVIRGETTHYDTVCNDSSRGLLLLGVEHGLAIGNGILTVETMAQAEVRADPEGQDKGGAAAAAALHLAALTRRFRRSTITEDGETILLAGDPGTIRTA